MFKYQCQSIIFLLVLLLFFFICTQTTNEHFTAPGLTLTIPPSWYPQNSAQKYKPSDWKVKTYLDRYPIYDPRTKNYIGYQETQDIASTNRFWRS